MSQKIKRIAHRGEITPPHAAPCEEPPSLLGRLLFKSGEDAKQRINAHTPEPSVPNEPECIQDRGRSHSVKEKSRNKSDSLSTDFGRTRAVSAGGARSNTDDVLEVNLDIDTPLPPPEIAPWEKFEPHPMPARNTQKDDFDKPLPPPDIAPWEQFALPPPDSPKPLRTEHSPTSVRQSDKHARKSETPHVGVFRPGSFNGKDTKDVFSSKNSGTRASVAGSKPAQFEARASGKHSADVAPWENEANLPSTSEGHRSQKSKSMESSLKSSSHDDVNDEYGSARLRAGSARDDAYRATEMWNYLCADLQVRFPDYVASKRTSLLAAFSTKDEQFLNHFDGKILVDWLVHYLAQSYYFQGREITREKAASLAGKLLYQRFILPIKPGPEEDEASTFGDDKRHIYELNVKKFVQTDLTELNQLSETQRMKFSRSFHELPQPGDDARLDGLSPGPARMSKGQARLGSGSFSSFPGAAGSSDDV